MMCERTPVSVALIAQYCIIAAEVLKRAVLSGRAKGTWYQAGTGWHRESVHDIGGVGVLAYLEPETPAQGEPVCTLSVCRASPSWAARCGPSSLHWTEGRRVHYVRL
jgi:hypothetical protein